MEKITYEPIVEDFQEPITRADLDSIYKKLVRLYAGEKMPEKIIQFENE